MHDILSRWYSYVACKCWLQKHTEALDGAHCRHLQSCHVEWTSWMTKVYLVNQLDFFSDTAAHHKNLRDFRCCQGLGKCFDIKFPVLHFWYLNLGQSLAELVLISANRMKGSPKQVTDVTGDLCIQHLEWTKSWKLDIKWPSIACGSRFLGTHVLQLCGVECFTA